MEYILEILSLLEKGIKISLSYFINPDKRIYLLYLFSSLLLAYYVYRKTNRKESLKRYIFHPKIWKSKSAFVDYSFYLFNGLIKIIFIAPYVVLGLYLAYHINEILLINFGYISNPLGKTTTIIIYTICLTIFKDLVSFITHLLMHKVKFLWEFHKIHHSATTLNPITQYRIHPIELIINNITSIFAFGIITGIFDYLSLNEINKFVFLGVNLFTFIFFILGANLRHSHVKLSYPKLIEHLFISPYQHQIHHSKDKEYHDKNFGSKFAIWDYLFGTLVFSGKKKSIRFGVNDPSKKYSSFIYNLSSPFSNIWKKFKNIFTILD